MPTGYAARFLAASVLLAGVGCASDEDSTPATTADTAAVDTAATDTAGADTPSAADSGAAGDLVVAPEVAIDVPPDVGPDLSGEVSPPVPDGLNGSPCESSADCVQSPEHVCFGGFCAERCRVDGQRVDGACETVSSASMFGPGFSCSSTLTLCSPGRVESRDILCTKDADCAPDTAGTTMVCAVAVLAAFRTVDGICVPGGERKDAGDPCQRDEECESLLCLGNDPEGGGLGVCTAHCTKNAHCPAGNLCHGIGFLTSGEATAPTAWAGLCDPISGSLTYCKQQATCPSGEVCEVFIEPSSLAPMYWCVEGNAGALAAGELCGTEGECLSDRCLLGDTGQEGIDGACSNTCQVAADCASGQRCAKVRLHNNGTLDDAGDDKRFGLCVFGDADDPCLLAQPDWCDGAFECTQSGAWEPGYGTCLPLP